MTQKTMVFQKFIVFSSYDLEKPWFRKTMVFSKPWKQSNLHSLRMQVKTTVFSMVFQNHGLIFILWPAGKLCFFFKSLFFSSSCRQRDDDGWQARRKNNNNILHLPHDGQRCCQIVDGRRFIILLIVKMKN